MTFSPEQVSALQAKLDRANVSTRSQSGRSLSYIEGWWALSEANRIFGFDGWSSQTTEIKCVAERERPVGQQGTPGWGVSYIAKVRVTVDEIVREGVGSGHGIDRDLGLAHESAIKEAETDARKRALMTFGNPFGLALYDKTQENVESRPAPANGHSEPIQQRDLSVHPDGKDFWKCDGPGMTAHYAKKEGFGELHEKMREQIRNLHTDTQRREWIEENLPDIQKMPKSWRVILRADLEEQAQPVAA